MSREAAKEKSPGEDTVSAQITTRRSTRADWQRDQPSPTRRMRSDAEKGMIACGGRVVTLLDLDLDLTFTRTVALESVSFLYGCFEVGLACLIFLALAMPSTFPGECESTYRK